MTSGFIQEDIEEWVSKNTYKVRAESRFISRCIDGRYENDENLPALAFPGGDAGEMAALLATADQFGFEIDSEKAWRILVDVLGGEKNIRFHTDSHADKHSIMGGCGHIKQMGLNPEAYGVKKEQIDFIQKVAEKTLKKYPVCQVNLHGDHMEGAVLVVEGDYGVYPQSKGKQVFIFHKTLVDKRHRALCKKLVESGAVMLMEGLDEEYLYQSFSDVTENHLMETVKRLARGLPIFSVLIRDGRDFRVENQGKVA